MLYSILRGQLSFMDAVMEILAVTIIILLILPLHELAHGFVAYKLGDNTAKRQGRLTLNPLHHIDYIGALCLLLVGFGWAEPVPVNPYNLKNPKRDMALVALAGPVANLIAALAGYLVANLLVTVVPASQMSAAWFSAVLTFLSYYCSVNVGLAVFNLIPLPPLDGSKILGAFLPDRTYVKMQMNERMLSIILIVCVWIGVVDKIVYYPRIWIDSALWFVASLPFLPFR